MTFEVPPTRRSWLSRYGPWAVAITILGAGAWLLFSPRVIEPPEVQVAPAPDVAAPATTPVTVFFGDRDGRALQSEKRDIVLPSDFEARVTAVVAALASQPASASGVSALPPRTRLQRVFRDAESGTLFLDFDSALVTEHPGGSTAEWATLAALVRTIGANFPEVARVQVLVDGQPVETLAGHYDTSQPLDVAAWKEAE